MAEMIVSFSVMLDCCHLESCSFLKGNIGGIDLGERRWGNAERSGGEKTVFGIYCMRDATLTAT